MKLEEAVEGALKTREALRSRQGVENPVFISENMQRLAQYVGAIEEHLAILEEELEVTYAKKFHEYIENEKSPNMSEQLAKVDMAKRRGQIAKLSRYVNSSWKLVTTAQSRFNHIEIQQKEG